METVNELEKIFQKIKDDKKGNYIYKEIAENLSQKISEKFPDCKKNVPVRINENHINSDLNVHFIINSIPVAITNNEHGMAPGMLSSIMHVLACKIGVSINVGYDDEFKFTRLQNPSYQ